MIENLNIWEKFCWYGFAFHNSFYFLNPGISGRGVYKVNTLPIEISNLDKLESISGLGQLKLERSKSERHRHYNIRSEEAAQIFDDKISIQQKVRSVNDSLLFFFCNFYLYTLSAFSSPQIAFPTKSLPPKFI